MAAPKKYSDELRERATRMALDARRDPATSTGAIKRVADQLGIHPEALRTWVKLTTGVPVTLLKAVGVPPARPSFALRYCSRPVIVSVCPGASVATSAAMVLP